MIGDHLPCGRDSRQEHNPSYNPSGHSITPFVRSSRAHSPTEESDLSREKGIGWRVFRR